MEAILQSPALLATLALGLASIIYYLAKSRPQNARQLPAKMKRLAVLEVPEDFTDFSDFKKFKVAVEEVSVPEPGPGEVLVKMVAAAVNPSDEGDLKLACQGKPEGIKLPRVFGREGSGVVVGTGSGILAARLMGKKVGVCGMDAGTWQEYVVMPAKPPGTCTLDQNLPVETAASFFVNPLTAVGLCDVAKRKGSPAFIHTVGNSQLGQMMVKLARSQGVTIVNMVRKEEAAELLKSLGAEHVVVTSREDWQEELKKKITQLKVSVAFDAIGGDMTATMMRLMPEGSTSVVYGGLAGGLMNNIPVVEMIYGNKKVEAFFLRTWLTEGGMLRTLMRIRRSFALTMAALGAGGWAESQFEDCRLEDMWQMMSRSQSRTKKLRIRMDM